MLLSVFLDTEDMVYCKWKLQLRGALKLGDADIHTQT